MRYVLCSQLGRNLVDVNQNRSIVLLRCHILPLKCTSTITINITNTDCSLFFISLLHLYDDSVDCGACRIPPMRLRIMRAFTAECSVHRLVAAERAGLKVANGLRCGCVFLIYVRCGLPEDISCDCGFQFFLAAKILHGIHVILQFEFGRSLCTHRDGPIRISDQGALPFR